MRERLGKGGFTPPFPDESGALIPTVGAGADNTRAMSSTLSPDFHHCSAAYAPSPRLAFTRVQRACDALRAPSLRSSAVMLAARVWPPKAPPLRPMRIKYASASGGSAFRFAMPHDTVPPVRMQEKIIFGFLAIPLDIRRGGTQ